MQKRLADSEWIILNALWGRPPQTMKQIVEIIQAQQPDVTWSYKTYHTYLRNMTAKGIVTAEERNLKDKLYAAAVTEGRRIACRGARAAVAQGLFRVGRPTRRDDGRERAAVEKGHGGA